MRGYQKVIIGILGIVTLMVLGVTAYGMKVFYDTNQSFNKMVEKVDRDSDKRTESVSIEDRDPFSILLMGIDTGALGRTEQGRSDSMMVVTVNPKKEQSTIVSLERDIFTQIPGYGSADKLNAAYAYGGVEMAMDTVENLLDIPLDHYVTINMQGLSDLIDAVGGIKVNNKIDFTLEGVHVPKGKITLDGETGLAYARMRKDDPEGNVGRQRRQREVITKIIEKVMSFDSVSNYKKILAAVEKNSRTDLEWDDMLDIGENYIPALSNVKQVQLEGQSSMVNGISYQILGVNELLKVQNTLKTQLDLPTDETLQSTENFAYGQLYDDATSSEESQTSLSEDETSSYSDAAAVVNGYTDNGYSDTNTVDNGYTDNGYSDTNTVDNGYTDNGYSDTNTVDNGYTDNGYSDTNIVDNGYIDNGYSDTNTVDNGYTDNEYTEYYTNTGGY
ncbi:MAG: LCP family protein [Enterococcus sp.]